MEIIMKNGLIVNEFGTKCYYLNNLLHREDGPAIECANGNKSYWINDIIFYEQDYWNEIKRRKSLKFIIKNYISSI